MVAVAAVFGALGLVFGAGAQTEPASEVDRAVLIDLPPADSSSEPARRAEDGPEQSAAATASAVQLPDQVQLPQPTEMPQTAVSEPDVAVPVVRPQPAAVLERRQDQTPAPSVAPPPSPAQEDRAPPGADAPIKAVGSGDDGAPHPSARVITLWQRSLMRRLEAAKHSLRRVARGEGVVEIAFEIDGRGAIRTERLASSSGSAPLDRAALALVAQAAPFPVPPAGIAGRDLSFVVPVRFK